MACQECHELPLMAKWPKAALPRIDWPKAALPRSVAMESPTRKMILLRREL